MLGQRRRRWPNIKPTVGQRSALVVLVELRTDNFSGHRATPAVILYHNIASLVYSVVSATFKVTDTTF